jgi:hypothetical protein
MYYLRARYMQPQTGRFFTQDSYEGSPFDPSSLHKYTFAANDPVNLVDPSGQMSSIEMTAVVAVSGIIASMAIGGFYNKLKGGSFTEGAISSGLYALGVVGALALAYLIGVPAGIIAIVAAGVNLGFAVVGGVGAYFDYQDGYTEAAALQGVSSALALFGGLSMIKQLSISPQPPDLFVGNVSADSAAGDGSYYSVAYEMKLDASDYGRSRSVHFNRANAALDQALNSDPELAAQMETMIPGIRDSVSSTGGRVTPDGWVWHHSPDSGIMQLVPQTEHTPGSIYWMTLHPNNRGGYAIWAVPAGAPRK